MDDSASAGSSSGSSDTWLHDDHRILIYTLVGLALAIGGHRTWQEYHRHKENAARRARILRLVESSRREKEKERKLGSEVAIDGADSVRRLAEAPPPAVAATSNQGEPEAHAEALHQGLSASTSDLHAPSGSESSGAVKRPKDRRKRGRDVYKEVLKQERKKVAVSPSTSKTSTHVGSNSFLQVQSTSGSDADASRSRSRSISPSRIRSIPVPVPVSVSEYHSTEDTPRPKTAEWGAQAAPTHTHDVDHDGRSDYSSMSDSLSSLGAGTHGSGTSHTSLSASVSVGLSNPNERGSTEVDANVTNDYKPRTPPLTRSGPSSTASESTSVSVDAGSPPISLNLDLIVEDGESSSSPAHDVISISQPVPSALPAKTQPPWLPSPHVTRQYPKGHPKTDSNSSVASFVASEASVSSGWDGGSYRRRSSKSPPPPPRFRSLSRVSTASLSPLPFVNNLSLQEPEAGSGRSFSSTPPPLPPTYRNALEQARRREEAYRREAERFRQECDVLRFRWNEDAELGRRREADLQAQLQQVTAQMQTLSMTVSQMQMQPYPYPQQQHMHQSSQSRPGFPVHPPLHSTASLPPMPMPGPYGYLPPNFISSPGPVPGGVPYPFPLITNLPHMTPRSTSESAAGRAENGSPAREYALGAFDVASPSPRGGRERGDSLRGQNGDEVNEELAEAILKRPESMRSPTVASNSGFVFGAAYEAMHNDGASSNRGGSRSASVVGRATRDGFTFASLSELGNPQPQPGSECDSFERQENDDEHDNQWDGISGDNLQNSEAVNDEAPITQSSNEHYANYGNLDTTKSDGDFTIVSCHSALQPPGDAEGSTSDMNTNGELNEGESITVN